MFHRIWPFQERRPIESRGEQLERSLPGMRVRECFRFLVRLVTLEQTNFRILSTSLTGDNRFRPSQMTLTVECRLETSRGSNLSLTAKAGHGKHSAVDHLLRIISSQTGLSIEVFSSGTDFSHFAGKNSQRVAAGEESPSHVTVGGLLTARAPADPSLQMSAVLGIARSFVE